MSRWPRLWPATAAYGAIVGTLALALAVKGLLG